MVNHDKICMRMIRSVVISEKSSSKDLNGGHRNLPKQ